MDKVSTGSSDERNETKANSGQPVLNQTIEYEDRPAINEKVLCTHGRKDAFVFLRRAPSEFLKKQ